MSSKYSLEEYVHLGKQKYREKRYEEALGHYQSALQIVESLDILDALAAITDKLGRADVSLRYGKKMLHLQETSARGYLRVGRTLQAKPEWKIKELAIYERGLKKALPSDPQHKLLVSLQHRLKRELNPPASYDPLVVMPAEIVHMIYGYIQFYELVRSLRVSKAWYRHLTTQPWLWQHIDITTAKESLQKRLPAKSLIQWMTWAQFKVKAADLGAYSHSQSVLALVTRCRALSSLTFSKNSSLEASTVLGFLKNAKNLKTFVYKKPCFAEGWLPSILSSCKQLEHLETSLDGLTHISFLPADMRGPVKLKHLTLTGRPASHEVTGNENLQKLLDSAPELETLSLSGRTILVSGDVNPFDLSTLTRLTSLNLREMHRGPLRLPPTLKSLTIQDIRPFELTQGETAWFPDLLHVDISKCYHVCDILETLLNQPTNETDYEKPLKEFSKLESLKLGGLVWDNQPVMNALFQVNLRSVFQHPRVSDISTLSIEAPEFDDDTVDVIKDNLHNLGAVRLTNGMLTGIGVKRLVQSQPKLSWLVLDNCTSVSADAIAWAKSQGVRVVSKTKLPPRGNNRQ